MTTTLVAAGALVGVSGAAAAPMAPGLGGIIGAGSPVTDFTDGRYIVTLADNAVATYTGGVDGFAPTTPDAGARLDPHSRASASYSDYLGGKQKEAAASVDATIDYSYTLALNGFAAELTAAQAARLSAEKDVVAISPDELKHLTATSSTEFLGLSGDDGVWASTGGADNAGEGVVIGVLDTGFAPENPSFAGDALGSTAGDEPWLDGDTITMTKSDGTVFTGECVTGVQFDASDCSTKVVGARYFVTGYGADRIGGVDEGEYLSPRDGDGHGSHTASTAGGNHDVTATISGLDYGLISGVAPAAKIAAYKVCWTAAPGGDDGCATSDLLAGINQAVADNVDVLNYSIGGGAADTTVSPTDQAFLGAAAAGIFVAASAGNSGPGASTLDNASPWITTVAASTIPGYEATATFGDGTAYAGGSISVDRTPGSTPLAGTLVRGDLVAASGHDPADALLCGPDSLDPALVSGTIVLCERGIYDRVAKSAEVLRAGGIGTLLVNSVPGSVDTDEHTVPTIHLDSPYWEATFAYAGSAAASVIFTDGNTTSYTPPTPQVAGFSSRGPVLADGSDILKPDVTAPGVAILADGPNAEGGEPTWQFLSGTSMSSPQIAGLAALYLGERPLATPGEIKSAMMTSAYDTVDAGGDTVTDPFTQGAGHVDPTKMFEPGLLYLNDTEDWYSYIQGIGYDVGSDPVDPSNLNLASIAIGSLTAPETITRTVTSTEAGTFTAQPVTVPGIDAVVSPSTLSFGAAGDSASYTVTFTRTDAPLDTFSTGSLNWVSGSGTVVHSPVAIQPVTLVAPATANGTGVDGSVDVSITPGATGDIALNLTGLAAGLHQSDPADPASPNTGSGTAGDEYSYQVEVPEGTQLARFDLDAVDQTADLDLIVYRLNGDGGSPVAGWQSATGSADELIDLANPTAGFYQVINSVYSGTTAFNLNTYSVLAGAGEGSFAAAPPVVAGQQGVAATYSLSWAGLVPETGYLGLVGYGDSSVSTVVSVASGAAPEPEAPMNTALPSIEGTAVVGAKLTAQAGEWNVAGLDYSYQWQADGRDIEKATKVDYKPTKSLGGETLTVVVTARADGIPDGTATSAGVVVKYAATADVTVDSKAKPHSKGVTIEVSLKTDAPRSAPLGTVQVLVDDQSYDVALDPKGKGSLTLTDLDRGSYTVVAQYAGTDLVAAANSKPRTLTVR
ncbi:S8 family serine peptidase [Cryobacterium sp. PH31-L1]|uniref:S8 family serine peptidase n=1 Tax=Cryobacterium sp. PH31-L1 TaxID=3046199 RepID=UPI0024B9FE98|nr:S8 family serine peptidase [Cryobacterium sp. PH31-L1]MDJ0376159.1 S8 family serine peptidase [Cryobacterium sp. PH31-L1]